MQESIWTKTVDLPLFPALEGSIKTDVLVIGGGMAGLLCAHWLQQSGTEYMVIEAERIGGGVTGNTTAKITSQHGLIYQDLLKTYGKERAWGYWEANQAALAQYRQLAARIPCDFEAKDSFVYIREDTARLDAELEALFRLGIPAESVHTLPLPMPTAGAVCFRDQGQFHPLKFLAGLAEGLNIRERTRAYRIEKGRVFTDRGCIRAEKIIVATHFPILNRRGLYFLKQYQDRSYVLALSGAPKPAGMYLDGGGNGLSFRSQGDLLLLGGGSHRTGKPTGGWEPLTVFAAAHYPGTRVEARWAAQDCMTLDGIPYIGRYSPRMPWLFVATGFNKWGMTGAMAASLILRDQILGLQNPFAPLFDPGRSMLHPQLALNIRDAAVNLLTPTAPRCPHMGCALKWNPWEHSWDCPCHGSRFSGTGEVLDAPAISPLKNPDP